MEHKIIQTNYLYHYGIKGQKYGQRRFQNLDGSLTAAGASRYGVGKGIKNTMAGTSQDQQNKDKNNSNSAPTTKELEPDDLKQIFGSDFEAMKAKVAQVLASKGPGAKELTPEEVKTLLGNNFDKIKSQVDNRLAEKSKQFDEAQKKTTTDSDSSKKKTSSKKKSSKKSTEENDDKKTSTKKKTSSKKKSSNKKTEQKKSVDEQTVENNRNLLATYKKGKLSSKEKYNQSVARSNALESEVKTKKKAAKTGSQASQEYRIAAAKLQNSQKETKRLKKSIRHSYAIVSENELYHHGVLGQKWGVRRYQNYNGSYTKAGLKRYENSKKTHDDMKTIRKNLKSSMKTGEDLMVEDKKTGDVYKFKANKDTYKNVKNAERSARKQMNKDYKHLSQDMKADKGKERYAKGERITANNQINSAIETVGGITISAAVYGKKMGLIDNKVAAALAITGGATIAASTVKRAVDEHANNQLRAYYAHTSKY